MKTIFALIAIVLVGAILSGHAGVITAQIDGFTASLQSQASTPFEGLDSLTADMESGW